MIANMPTSTFLLYIGAFVVQFVFVIGYGIWWCLPSGWFIAAAFANGYYLSGKWRERIRKRFAH